MDEEYDVIILGTGLTESLLSGLLATSGHKVLVMDRNRYYGGEAASLNLDQLFEKFNRGKAPESLGKSRDYNVDLVSKLLMANGKLVKMLQKTGVTKYGTEFSLIDGSFVVHKGKTHRVPVTEREALASNLMGIFEKRRAAKFFAFAQEYDPKNPKTHQGHDLQKSTMADIFSKFGLSNTTIDFIGHALALQETSEYLHQPAEPTIMKIKLYEESLSMYEDAKAPYVYPLYGLGELPQIFSRLCAVYGGTFMLDKPVAKVHYDESGKFVGVESQGEIAKAKKVIGDPTYFSDKVKKVGQTVRVICLMNHPIKDAKDSKSCQVIISGSELNRKSDIYVTLLSDIHRVVPKNMYLGLVSTTVETDNPEEEVKPGLALLGDVIEKFVNISDLCVPLQDGSADHVFVSKSYDASTHFESTSKDILDLYFRVTGKEYDYLSPPAEEQ